MALSKSKPVRYSLMVMPPGTSPAWPPPDEEPEPLLWLKSSSTPFQAFHVGDELLPRNFTLREEQQRALSKLILRVVKVRRCIAVSDGLIDDQIVLYTEDARKAGARARGGNPEMN